MSRTWRSVRVFISSTFRDMQSERDHLVKVVFPELRHRMAGLNLHLVDIDLRWGVPEEEVEKGRVLDAVLEEVERARPFFVALLGERYGTVPPGLPDGTALAHPWLSAFPGHSITALEIVHGVLRDPKFGRKAYFYFRDPGLIAQISPERRADYEAEDPRFAAKVQSLKEMIRASGRPVMEGYPCRWDGESSRVAGLETFGERVLEDLWAGIREEYPDEAPEPDPLVLERRMHDAFAEEHSRFFIGREDELGRLTGCVEGGGRRPVVVTGEPGGGKSALLSSWAERYAGERPGSYLLACYIGASPESSNHFRLLRHMCGRLKREFGLLEEIPEDDGKLPETLGLMLLSASRKNKDLVVVVDGLDLISSLEPGRGSNWLVDVVPERVRLIVSAQRGEALEFLRRRGVEEVSLPPLQEAERARLVNAVLGEYGRKLGESQLEALLSHPGAGNPLYLRTALEELRLFGRFEGLTDRIMSLARDIPGLFVQVLERLEEDHGRDFVAEVFSLIRCSRFGLAEVELLSLLDQGSRGRFPRNLWTRLRRSARFYLIQRGDLIGLAHRPMSEAVSLSYSPGKAVHERLAGVFRTAPVERKLDEYPYQLRRAEDWERLEAVLGDLDLFEQARERGKELEWMGYWRALEGRAEAWRAYRSALDVRIARDGESEKTADLATRLGLFLHAAGDLSHIEGFFRQALAIRERVLPPGSPDTARSLNDLGGLSYRQGKYPQAETFFKRSLAIFEKASGNDPAALVASLNNLAELYRAQGRYLEAEPLYERAGEVQENALGPNSPEVANNLHNRARLLFAEGRYDDAERLFERSGRIIERVLGADHPALATALSSLAALYQARGRFSEAERLTERSLDIYTRTFGPEHRNVATALNNMASILREMGRTAEAEPLFLRSAEIIEKTSGPEHPDLGQSLNNLAQLYQAQSRLAEAETTFRRALAILEKAWGPSHLEVGRCLNNLGSLYHALGRPSDAEESLRRSIGVFERTLGPDHPDLAKSLNNLGQLYQALGRYADAEALYERSLEILAGSLGPEHLDVARSLHNLAGFYHARGRPGDSEILFRQAIALKEKSLGPGHPDVALSLNNLGELFYDQGKYRDAEAIFVRALDIRDKTLDPGHPELALSLNNLAWLYDTQGRHAAAESLYRRALRIAVGTLGEGHPTTSAIKENLEGCLDALRRRPS